MRIYLIRHGATRGNKEGRYVGRTDEGLLPEGKRELIKRVSRWRSAGSLEEKEDDFLKIDRLYVSPLRRCRETAAILYPHREQTAVEGLRECDFGEFEYMNFRELDGNPVYQQFIDSKGESGFPGGETLRAFQGRCAEAFRQIVEEKLKEGRERSAALVVHGGTIMAILDRYSMPHRDYYEWQVKNGEGFSASVVMSESLLQTAGGSADGFYLGDIRSLW